MSDPTLEAQLGLGVHLRNRREEIRISQATLAWLARVSRNTVSNLERDAVAEPDDRVLNNVEAALGLDHWYAYSSTHHPRDAMLLVQPRIAHRLIEVIERLKREDPKTARDAADAYVAFMAALRDARDDDSRLSAHQALQEEAGRLAQFIVPRLDLATELDSSIRAFLEDQGWSPEDSTFLGGGAALISVRASTTDSARMTETAARIHSELDKLREQIGQMTETFAPALFVRHDEANAFGRLPIRVQDALLSGQVIDADIVKPPHTEGISLLTMVVRQDDSEAPLTAEGRKALINSLHIWHLSLVAAAGMFSFMQKHSWMAPEVVEDRIKEALAVITESPQTGLATHPGQSDSATEPDHSSEEAR
ncbi:XRE family transcriptional regulator [Sphaerisporangium album]|uniref:XRE family transcriptional regulator n=1 Tax=Sphaerisporangium album TaxID=509200 RepID=A0A367FGH1_9ACTN|nr:helix-turn-helix transcriptional regulator [Sphaerisporangium album]RCG29009.1 XRE family transcriptional regulator [Sphaerisporangium album]